MQAFAHLLSYVHTAVVIRFAAVAFTAIYALGCATSAATVPAPPVVAGPELALHVFAACDQPEVSLSGVEVTAISADGRELKLGHTFGDLIRINKAKLRADDARVLLVCAEYFECVALRIDEQNLYAFDEYYVDLPKVTVR